MAAKKEGQQLKGEQDEKFKMTRTSGEEAYILERTLALFTGRSDESCSGVVRLAPANLEADPQRSADSGAGPLLPGGLRVVLRSLGGSGIALLTSAASEVGP
jgi:hypothetical protein